MGGAIRDLGQAAELGAGGGSLWILAYVCAQVGRMAEARRYADRAVSVDPGHWGSRLAQAGAALMDGHFDAALVPLRSAVDLTGGELIVKMWLGIFTAYAGRDEEACDLLREVASAGEGAVSAASAVFGASLRKDRDAFRQALAESPILDLARQDKEFSWWLADSFARMGDTDEALRWLGSAIDLGFTNHRFWSEVDPFLAPLRPDPRFQALMNRAREKQRAFEG